MNLTSKSCTFMVDDAETADKPVVFRAYPHKSLCPVALIEKYIAHRELLSDDDKFFVTTRNPYHAATLDTLARWIKKTLEIAGIDIGKFKARSGSLETMVKCASWTNVDMFKNFYMQDIKQVYDLHVDSLHTVAA